MHAIYSNNLIKLEDKRPIGRFLLALAEGPSGPLVEMVTDGVSQEGPTGICVLLDFFSSCYGFVDCVFDLE